MAFQITTWPLKRGKTRHAFTTEDIEDTYPSTEDDSYFYNGESRRKLFNRGNDPLATIFFDRGILGRGTAWKSLGIVRKGSEM